MLTFLLTLALTTAELAVVSVPLSGNIRVELEPAGRVEFRRQDTVIRARIQVEMLPAIGSQGAGANVYVAWAVTPEGFLENIGELDNRGRLEATTRHVQQGILITAEPHYLVDRPSSIIVSRTAGVRDARIRQVTVSAQVGEYDYSTITFPPTGALPSIAVQAQHALRIARSLDVERWAPGELRQAQIALDTLEEMLRRQSPQDIMWPTANEAIRLSQHAIIMARERNSQMMLESLRREGEALRNERDRLEARILEITEQQNTATAQILRLESDLALRRGEIELYVQEREQAANRARGLEEQIAEMQQRVSMLQSLHGDLNLRLREDFIDPQNSELTAAGRDAVARILNYAAIVAGPIEIEGPASDEVFQAVRDYLISSGIPQERIITRP